MDKDLEEIKNKQEEIVRRLAKVEKYVKIAKMFTVLKFFLILVPVVLAVIYLPPFLENLFNEYFKILEELNLR